MNLDATTEALDLDSTVSFVGAELEVDPPLPTEPEPEPELEPEPEPEPENPDVSSTIIRPVMKMPEPAVPSQESETVESGPSRLPVMAAIIVLIVVTIGSVAFWFWKQQ